MQLLYPIKVNLKNERKNDTTNKYLIMITKRSGGDKFGLS